MRIRYACRCILCKRTVQAGAGDYIGWLEGIKDAEGIRRGSGHYGICDECKAAQKVEPQAVGR